VEDGWMPRWRSRWRGWSACCGLTSSLVWQRVVAGGPGSPRQVLAVGIDVVADEAAALLLARLCG
jgi:hypothetical protein